MTQVFQNLIGNAIKFHGTAPPVIQVEAARNEGDWLFSISDNGIGVPAEYAQEIFSIFKRLHTRREYPGNGIGLAICKRIIDQHHGKIWVESKDQGSAFKFTLPAISGEEAHDGHDKQN
jgi:two-component system, chemotaxis family, sensor kinase Cph1